MKPKHDLVAIVRDTPIARRGPKGWFDSLDPDTRRSVVALRRAHLRGELPHSKAQLFRIVKAECGLEIRMHAWDYWWEGDGKKLAEQSD